MKNKFFVLGISAMVLVFGLVIGGCGHGGGNPILEEIQSLPSFEGEFVASEEEAGELFSDAEPIIQAAITAALASSPVSSMRAVSLDGNYAYNGVTLKFTFTASDSYPTPPWTAKFIYRATIDGTYSGYVIKGRYDYDENASQSDASTYSGDLNFDEVLSISYNGKGAKFVITGTAAASTSPSLSMVYDLHYAVYDNENVLRYNFDYSFTYP
jgi:hypothetical protein